MVEKFPKHISFFEWATAVIIGLVLILAIIAQIFFDSDTLRLIVILAVSELVLSYLVFWPETYEFRENSLVIMTGKQRIRKEILYNTVFDLDTVGRFRDAKRDADTVEVIVIYVPKEGETPRTISCHPKNVQAFVEKLQSRCPNLGQEDE